MMEAAGILHKYGDVLEEFPVVVEAGGAWTSVTPGSQQYWLQAFNNVLHGRWKKMDPGYGRSVLGYFGKPPLDPDPEVVKVAAEQLGMPPFDGDPLEAAPDSLSAAKAALEERGLEVNDENVFLVASAIVPGKNMELNEGIRLLTGKAKIVLPLKPAKEEAAPPAAAPAGGGATLLTGPVSTTCKVVEGGKVRTFEITLSPPGAAPVDTPAAATAAASKQTHVYSPFEGKVELVDISVKVGDSVTEGQVVAAVEAMKAKHDVKAPCDGIVLSVDADLGAEVSAGKPILTLG
jgi:pyruvate carboxylase subunit B